MTPPRNSDGGSSEDELVARIIPLRQRGRQGEVADGVEGQPPSSPVEEDPEVEPGVAPGAESEQTPWLGGDLFDPSAEPPIPRRRPAVEPALSAGAGLPRIGHPIVHLRLRADRRLFLVAAGLLVAFAVAFAVASLVRHVKSSQAGSPPPAVAPNRVDAGSTAGSGPRVNSSDASHRKAPRRPGARGSAAGQRGVPGRVTAVTASGDNGGASPSVRQRPGADNQRHVASPLVVTSSAGGEGPPASEREFGFEG